MSHQVRAGLAQRVNERKSLVAEGAVMAGKSLGLFGITNRVRLRTFKAVYSQVALQPAF